MPANDHFLLGLFGRVEGQVTGQVGESVDATVVFVDALEDRLRKFDGGKVLAGDSRR